MATIAIQNGITPVPKAQLIVENQQLILHNTDYSAATCGLASEPKARDRQAVYPILQHHKLFEPLRT